MFDRITITNDNMVTDKKMFNTCIQLHVAFSSLEFANTVSRAYTISSHVITKPFL